MNTSIKITLSFLIFGIVWICLTDFISLSVSDHNLKRYNEIQTTKGIVFIVLSAALIYFVSKKLNKPVIDGNKHLTDTNSQLENLLEEKVNYQKKLRRRSSMYRRQNVNGWGKNFMITSPRYWPPRNFTSGLRSKSPA